MCFVFYKDKLLMINRNKKPFMGLWNVLGGKAKENETPLKCVIREVKEEGKIDVKNVKLLSKFTWNYDDDISYAFTAELDGFIDEKCFPFKIEEGIIDIKDVNWVLQEKNFGVVEDLKIFLLDIKNNTPKNYHLVYKDSKLLKAIKVDE